MTDTPAAAPPAESAATSVATGDEAAEIINQREENERRGITGRRYLTCEKFGDVLEVREGLACRHPKVTCKYRLSCPIYQIGRNE
ncbi:MAG: hypothetical protein JW781_08475 [Deltaproteobacteria bacterium]|nr:hypothetical protein [Candidatus Anaeroferrophillacea bacterium]